MSLSFGFAPVTEADFGALRDSDANRFYQRHGFVKVSEDARDVACERPRHLMAV